MVEKDNEAGERLLKTILEDRPAEVNVHSLLVEHYEREMEELVLEDTFDFMYWFLFYRKQSNEKVPGMVYAEEKGKLSEDAKKELKKDYDAFVLYFGTEERIFNFCATL